MKHEIKEIRLRRRTAVMVHKDDVEEYKEHLKLVDRIDRWLHRKTNKK